MKSVFQVFKVLTFHYYRRFKLRWILCTSGVAIGVAVATSINLTSDRAVYSFSETLESVTGTANLQLTADPGLNPDSLWSASWLWKVGYYSPFIQTAGTSKGKTYRLYGFDFVGDRRIRQLQTLQNDSIKTTVNGVFIPVDSPLGKEGDTVTIVINAVRYQLIIAGKVSAISGKLPPRNAIFADLSLLLPITKTVSGLDISVPADSLDSVKNKLQLQFPTARIETLNERKQTTAELFSAFRMNLQALGLIALLVSAYLVYNTLFLSVIQRRQTINLLLSLGSHRRSIFIALLIEGAFFGTIGGLFGLAVGILLASLTYSEVSQTLTAVFQLSDSQLSSFSWMALAGSYLTGIIFATLAAWYPAWLGSGTPISRSLKRGQSEFSSARLKKSVIIGVSTLLLVLFSVWMASVTENPLWGYAGVTFSILMLSFLAPPVLILLTSLLKKLSSAGEILLATSSVKEHMVKVSIAVAALTMTLSMVGAVGIMVHSFRTTLDDWLTRSIVADIYLKSSSDPTQLVGTINPEVMAILRNHPMTENVITLRTTQIKIDGLLTDIGANETSVYFKASPADLVAGNPENLGLLQKKGGVAVSEVFANKHHLTAGDTVHIRQYAYPILAVYRNYSSDRGFLLMDTLQFSQLFGYKDPTAAAVFLKPGISSESALLSLRDSLKNFEMDLSVNKDIRENALAIFDQTFRMTRILQLISFFIALLAVITTLSSIILERRKDFATLVSLGSSTFGMYRSLSMESLILTGTSLILAAAGSGVLSALLIQVINRYSFGWTIVTDIPFGELAFTGVVMILVSLIAAAFPMKMIKKLNLPENLKGNIG